MDNRLELYEKGLTDTKIAKIIGVSVSAICIWRKKNELKSNGKRGRPIGGKAPPEVRKVWREYQRQRRAKKPHIPSKNGKEAS